MSKRSVRYERMMRERYQNGSPLSKAARLDFKGDDDKKAAAEKVDGDVPIVHGFMVYRCESCGHEFNMFLEIGVEDHGKHGRPHQPCPFCIGCVKCGKTAVDISGYKPLMFTHRLPSGVHYFAYDASGREQACGRPTVYLEKGDNHGK